MEHFDDRLLNSAASTSDVTDANIQGYMRTNVTENNTLPMQRNLTVGQKRLPNKFGNNSMITDMK